MNFYKRNRKSIRLQYYDYAQPGFYFITICTHKMRHIFGEIFNGHMILNHYGEVAKRKWMNTENIRSNIKLGSFVIMPNHMHAVFQIADAEKTVGAYSDLPLPRVFKSPSNSVGAIVRGYKSTVTRQINQIRKTSLPKIWQRNYYEHIIRDQESLNKITEYIDMNPGLWDKDRYCR
ncbi:MAG: transposase [Gracilimonas sp.]|uniref:transposase n=1 Tax=Gracilimonas sp. TaxID=1974203 RepID=UPI0019C9466E|nr:transposase [Gracilimonas sp.]MBD3616852.1 transposase [Gracilimonas sp.]